MDRNRTEKVKATWLGKKKTGLRGLGKSESSR
jgi:hypothetical protein